MKRAAKDLPLSFPAHTAASWRQVRRYAVPRWMIERATQHRLAGDWRGALATANVVTELDLLLVRRTYGAALADRLEDDLHHLAPDLVRWHLPRVLGGRSTIATDTTIVLAEYPMRSADRPALCVQTPRMVDGPQTLRLSLGTLPEEPQGRNRLLIERWTGARHLWDARRSDELRIGAGGSVDRAPFLRPDGTPLPSGELAAGPDPSDPAAHTEWTARLVDEGRVEEAFDAAGITLAAEMNEGSWRRPPGDPIELLSRTTIAPVALAVALRSQTDGDHWRVPLSWWAGFALELTGGPGPLAALGTIGPRDVRRSLPAWRRLPDLDLLRFGLLTLDELHPSVRAALAPRAPAPDGPVGPPDPQTPERVFVRCGGDWHEVHSGAGTVRFPHTGQEHQRERALLAFGGKIAGCFAVHHSLRTGSGWLPRRMRTQRRELFLRAQHGDTDAVVWLLDAGMDPFVRDRRKRSLLHVLNQLDHEPLLGRLLAAGLDLEARDHHLRTPLHIAVGDNGSPELIRALLDAGARIDVTDQVGRTLRQTLLRRPRKDLASLAERLGLEGTT